MALNRSSDFIASCICTMRGSRNFCWGGGVQARRPENRVTTPFSIYLFSPQLIAYFTVKRGGLLQRKLYFPKHSERVQHFPGGGGGGGVAPIANFYSNPYNL